MYSQGVNDPTSVVGALEDELVLRPRGLLRRPSLLLELVPSPGRVREAALLERIPPIIEHPGVRVPEDILDAVLIGHRLDNRQQVLAALLLGETVGEVGAPARSHPHR